MIPENQPSLFYVFLFGGVQVQLWGCFVWAEVVLIMEFEGGRAITLQMLQTIPNRATRDPHAKDL